MYFHEDQVFHQIKQLYPNETDLDISFYMDVCEKLEVVVSVEGYVEHKRSLNITV